MRTAAALTAIILTGGGVECHGLRTAWPIVSGAVVAASEPDDGPCLGEEDAMKNVRGVAFALAALAGLVRPAWAG